MRIDHLLLNARAALSLQAAGVDAWVRGEDKASDHAPAWVRLDGARLDAAPAQPRARRQPVSRA
jgi:exonuclease III